MALTDKLSGKASKVTIASVSIPITKYTPKTSRKLVDVQDSTDYDPTTDMLWPAQLPNSISQEIAIEGVYNKTLIPANVINLLYSGAVAVAVTLGLDAGALYGHGNYDLSDFEADVDITDKVSYKATLVLNGIFTPNA